MRSHNLNVVGPTGLSSGDAEFGVSVEFEDLGLWMRSMVKTPPVVGMRATSPRERENVESSSWANCGMVVSVWYGWNVEDS